MSEVPSYIQALQNRPDSPTRRPNSIDFDTTNSPRKASKVAIESLEENERLREEISQLRDQIQMNQQEHKKEIDQYEKNFLIMKSQIAELQDNLQEISENRFKNDVSNETNENSKDKIIVDMEIQIQNLTNENLAIRQRYESLYDQLQVIQEDYQLIQDDNNTLRRRISLLSNSKGSPTRGNNRSPEKQYSEFNESPILKVPRTNSANSFCSPKSQGNQSTPKNPKSFNNASRLEQTPPNLFKPSVSTPTNGSPSSQVSTPLSGRRRPPSNHPALAEQIVFCDPKSEVKFKLDLRGKLPNELKNMLSILEEKQAELNKEISKTIPQAHNAAALHMRRKREQKEEELDEVTAQIGQIRLELRKYRD